MQINAVFSIKIQAHRLYNDFITVKQVQAGPAGTSGLFAVGAEDIIQDQRTGPVVHTGKENIINHL